MGSDGLRTKAPRAKGTSPSNPIRGTVFALLFEGYNHIVPDEPGERELFFRNLICTVLSVNIKDKTQDQQDRQPVSRYRQSGGGKPDFAVPKPC